jgi:glycosyltransferase involved in cell wall biosynthesis
LKILLINTNYGGGAGIACRRLHSALLAQGFDSNLLVLDKVNSPEEKNVYSIQEIISKKYGKGYFIFLKFINRLFNKLPTLLHTKAYINGPYSVFRIEQLAIYKESDIIHLHWVPKIISYKHVFADKQKVFFWTLHDMNPFTGGNHYTTDLDYNSFKKLLCKNILKKKIYLKDVNLTIISPSSWLAEIAKKSEVFKGFEIHHIPNCININTFKPSDKIQTREKLNVNFPNKTFMLFVAEDPNDNRKGMHILLTALRNVKNKNQFCLLIVGKKIEINDIDIQVVQLGFIKKEDDLVKCYNAADFFVNPSIEDNLPNTILESLSCGIPVLAFDTGGIPDLIEHEQNGYLGNEITSNNLVKGIKWLEENQCNKTLQLNARNKVKANYTFDKVTQQHVQLYELKIHSK